MPICAATLLSLLRRAGVSEPATPRVLGVDDWGFQHTHPTGTILVDLEQHRPVDLLMGSDEQVLTHWLQRHPGVQVISRDRGLGYRKAATTGAPSPGSLASAEKFGRCDPDNLGLPHRGLASGRPAGEKSSPTDVLWTR
jgi:hypothetical protein